MDKELLNSAGKSGLLLGLVGSIVSLLSYLLMGVIYSSMMWIMLWAFLTFAFTVAMVIYLGIRWRTSEGGFVTFGKSFMFLFLMLVMSGFVSLGSELLLYHVIEPDLQKQTGEMMASTMEDFFYSMDMSDDQVEEAVADVKKNSQNLTVTERLMTFKWRPAVHALLALILALFVRKEKPIFD